MHPKQTNAEPDHTIVWTTQFNPNGEKEQRMIQIMTETLASLGRKESDDTVRDLVLTLQEYDWTHFPAAWQGPDAVAPIAARMKSKVAYLLASTNVTEVATNVVPADTLTIQRILETDIGFMPPPLHDYVLREGPDAAWRELQAMNGKAEP